MDLNKRLKRSTGGIGGSNTTRWFFVLPAMAIVICLLIYPLMSTLVYSFTNKTMTKTTFKVIGLTNYVNVLKDPAFFAAFGHSLLWTAGSVLGQVIVGFAGALSLNRIKNKKFQNAFRICAIIPWAFPAIATAMVWKWMLNGIYGFIPTVLMNLGITDNMPPFLSIVFAEPMLSFAQVMIIGSIPYPFMIGRAMACRLCSMDGLTNFSSSILPP